MFLYLIANEPRCLLQTVLSIAILISNGPTVKASSQLPGGTRPWPRGITHALSLVAGREKIIGVSHVINWNVIPDADISSLNSNQRCFYFTSEDKYVDYKHGFLILIFIFLCRNFSLSNISRWN